MSDKFELPRINILDKYLQPELWPIFPRPVPIKILFVCEGIEFDGNGGFSFKILLDTLRDDSAVSYANFRVTLATWASNPGLTLHKDPNAGSYEPTYTNYRFSSAESGSAAPILDGYDEVWLFGISPNTNFPVDVASITASPLCPTQADLVALTRWMSAGGGVLAMGDHASLGANLCAKIPRVWTMRRWTQEDGAPPRIGPERLDTNRPMRPSQDPAVLNPPEEIVFAAQSDDVPQAIEVRRYHRLSVLGSSGWRPHPILCGGSLGVIDVLPDHPHEGWINERSDIALDAKVQFSVPAGVEDDEYPTVGGVQPRPQVIAWGHTLADPPHDHEKGDSPAKRFGVIGAYDGHGIALGRVVADSTWHHWMSINLSGTYEPSTDDDPSTPAIDPLVGLLEAGGADLAKILTYYRNVAVWLAPKAKQRRMLAYLAFWAAISTRTFEEWRPDTPLLVLGKEGRDVLGRATSDCFVSYWIRELIPIPRLEPPTFKNPKDPPCLTCPPDEWMEDVGFGVLLQRMMEFRDSVLGDKRPARLDREELEERLMDVFATARAEASQHVMRELSRDTEMLRERIDGLARAAASSRNRE